jgi:3-oxoacyl-[acyl-carrier-protein] synthase II
MLKKYEEKRVVITGVGPLSPIGFGKQALWESLIAQRVNLNKEEYYIDGEIWDSFWVHKIVNFDINEFNIPKDILEEINHWKEGKEDRDLLYILAAVQLALDDSLLSYNREDNDIGLFLTIEHPGFEPFCEEFAKESLNYLSKHSLREKDFSKVKMLRYLFDKLADRGYDLQTFMYLYLTSRVFGIHGYSLFTSNACASGLFALESAAQQIKYGKSKVAIVAGGDYSCTMFKHLWFKQRGLYAEDGRIKPFSQKADGIVLGDGASAIILEELEHAHSRGAHIYAEYLGGGFSLEGWKVVFPRLGSNSYQKAIQQALKNSNVEPGDIDLINPHGVGIRITDLYEAKAINDIFSKHNKKPFVSAFKPYVGHNLGGSALLETIILLLTMQNDLIPPTLNYEDYDAQSNINLVIQPTKSSLNTVMKLSCGFAGYNGAVILKKFTDMREGKECYYRKKEK